MIRPYIETGDAAQAATTAPGPADAMARILDRLERGKRATPAELAVLRDGITALQTAPRPALTNAERSFLRHALELAADAMVSAPCDYSPEDEASLAALRKLAGGES